MQCVRLDGVAVRHREAAVRHREAAVRHREAAVRHCKVAVRHCEVAVRHRGVARVRRCSPCLHRGRGRPRNTAERSPSDARGTGGQRPRPGIPRGMRGLETCLGHAPPTAPLTRGPTPNRRTFPGWFVKRAARERSRRLPRGACVVSRRALPVRVGAHAAGRRRSRPLRRGARMASGSF